MAEILKEWLAERLEREITWEANEFGELMKNGHIIAGVLRSYHAINEDKYYLILNSSAPTDIDNNWKYLTQWLHQIDVPIQENELKSIKEGKGSILLRVFYQMFLQLDKRDRTDFIKREREAVSNMVEKMDNRFKVEKIPEPKESSYADLSRPLLNEKHYIDWQKQKVAQVKDTYDFIRHKYAKILEKIIESKTPLEELSKADAKKLPPREKREIDEFELRYPSKFESYSYNKLLEMDEKVDAEKDEQQKLLLDTNWAKEFMENLYERLKTKTGTREFQEKLRKSMDEGLWDNKVAEEETNLDLSLAKKVMKLSQFEKQICTQIMETKQQARNLMRNRTEAEKEFAEERDHKFSQFLNNLRDQVQNEAIEIDFEKKRQQVLHEKLYAEKMKRKRQHYYEICYETMVSLVDYAARYGHFKQLIGDDIPDHFIHEWKNLFFTRQAIFDILEPMEHLVEETKVEEEYEPEEEEIIRLELDRQEVLNDVEYNEYHNYEYPWLLEKLIPNFEPESEDRKYEFLGSRVLGHTVFKLLEIKYPYPPQRPPADLPNFKSKAILRGLPDKSVTVPIQTLLSKHKIHVVRIECAVNFCLKKFKTELVGCTNIELNFDKFIAAAQSEENKELIRNMKTEEESQMLISQTSRFSIGLPPNCKIVQTPKVLPEEDIKLSEAAELGRYAFEALSFGDSLTDYLIAAMIVEYIKDQDDIEGFVIINYPNCYREAQVLEETFTGVPPPNGDLLEESDDMYLEESIIKHQKKPKDPYIDFRVSKFVKNPHQRIIPPPFVSYFTCYINLKETQNILEELVIWELNEENSELIDRFYASLGLNYSMYYETLDKDLLLQICMYIIGEVPLKSFSSLFGASILSLLQFHDSSTKRTKSKTVKPEASSIIGKSKAKLRKSSKIEGSSTLEVVKAPESETDFPITSDLVLQQSKVDSGQRMTIELTSAAVIEEEKILPGETFYEYGDIPIPEYIGVTLATCWEEYEKAYVHDMQQLFFAKRLQLNLLGPYVRFIKDKMHQIITSPSDKQYFVSQFQKRYNDFEDDWRQSTASKNEWHCRVQELKDQLHIICDDRKLNAEKQRQALICENWAIEELTTLANNYISCMQTEINMQYLILQNLHDFYYTTLKGLPPSERVSTSKPLFKIVRETDEPSGKVSAEDKVFRQLKQAYQDMQLKNILIDSSNNPFNGIIEANVKTAIKLITEKNEYYRSMINKEYLDMAKLIAPAKKKEEEPSSLTSEDVYKANALKCLDEWLVGVNGEMFRSILRTLVLQSKCYEDMKLISDNVSRAFYEIQENIDNYYDKEIMSVERLCKFIQMSVEKAKKIPENLVLDDDVFMIDPNLLHFEIIEESDEIPVCTDPVNFKLKQLARLRSQFKLVAPMGLALTQAFTYLLQEFVVFGKEGTEGALFPEIWRNVDPEQIPKLVLALYGETAYVDWRDFLIYCLNIRFPTLDELLDLRHNLRCKDEDSSELIAREEFLDVEFWFEQCPSENVNSTLRTHLIKQFLFELYEVSEDMMNYPALLLALCKNVNPIEGFATALSMAVGKKTCFLFEDCDEIICKLIKLKNEEEERCAYILKCCRELVDMMVDRAVDVCEGTTVEELPYEPPEPEKKGKKGDKGKDKGKDKKARPSTKDNVSRITEGKTSATSIKVQSTFICPPCEPTGEPVEKIEEEIVEEEEVKKEEAEMDPNLCYAVSQDVLWTILRVCLPWHFSLTPTERETPYLKQVQDVIERLQVNHKDGDIYVSMFLADFNICRILHKVKKFTEINMLEELQKILDHEDIVQ